MTVTTTGLTQAAGICAAAAGAIFIAVQINHPPTDSFLTDTNEWVVRCTAKAVMCALALAGITGIYLRQVRQMRVLGLVGFVLFAVGYLLLLATEVMAAAVLPALTDKAPAFVNDVVVAAAGGTPTGDIGHLQILFNLTGACYILGGLIFGIALFRARVLARWAAVLLAVSHRRHRRARRTAGVVQPADGRPRRRCPHRPRHLAVARPAEQSPVPPLPETAAGEPLAVR